MFRVCSLPFAHHLLSTCCLSGTTVGPGLRGVDAAWCVCVCVGGGGRGEEVALRISPLSSLSTSAVSSPPSVG